jgi:hypothetical protein
MFIKVPSGQTGSAWEWYHWIGLEKEINRNRFLFFILELEYMRRVHSSEPLHAKINPTSYLFGSRFACLKPRSFPPNCAPKMQERQQLFLDHSSWVKNSNIQNPNQNRATLWRIFSSKKSAPANRKTGFYANRDQNKQKVGFILNEAAQNFEVLSNIQEWN